MTGYASRHVRLQCMQFIHVGIHCIQQVSKQLLCLACSQTCHVSTIHQCFQRVASVASHYKEKAQCAVKLQNCLHPRLLQISQKCHITAPQRKRQPLQHPVEAVSLFAVILPSKERHGLPIQFKGFRLSMLFRLPPKQFMLGVSLPLIPVKQRLFPLDFIEKPIDFLLMFLVFLLIVVYPLHTEG